MANEQWTWVQDRQIPSDTSEGRKIITEFLEHLSTEEWAEDDVFGIHLAFEEALVNAITHGNGLDPSKQVHIKMQTSPTAVRIEIRDEGPGFVPAEVPDPTDEDHLEMPSGRGIMLMRSFMSNVEYLDSGNQVVMEKQRS